LHGVRIITLVGDATAAWLRGCARQSRQRRN
jgi:hypothetical protein